MANQQLKAKLIACNVPTKNMAASRNFYDTLFGGQDFARSLNDKTESYFRPISQDGLTLTVGARWNEREPITCIFAVDNLQETIQQLTAAGGKVVVNPTAMAVSGPPQAVEVFHQSLASGTPGTAGATVASSNSMGQFATMVDPDGNYLGLMQVDQSMQAHFKSQPEQRTLSATQIQHLENWKQRGEPAMK